MFIEYIYSVGAGASDRKPITAELEPQETSVCTCTECHRARPEQCNTI